ncbi:MAG TPA: glycoside hydrolase family 97 N-terminal domain-containing protein, partial [Candidatus Sulfotelmatobacter sp.]|nr:glycoside hydrolase family 97 N-terminal domain-containing protein [Candidatus Sulfotelmatobacter sp.]
MKITVLLLVASAGLLQWVGAAKAEEWSVLSPNGQVKVSVQHGTRLSYRVEQGTEGRRAVVIADSPLGLRLAGQNFIEDLRFEAASPQKQIEDSYTLLHGKRRECRNQGTQLTLSFRNRAGQPLELDLR